MAKILNGVVEGMDAKSEDFIKDFVFIKEKISNIRLKRPSL
jgi:hypothetical protein